MGILNVPKQRPRSHLSAILSESAVSGLGQHLVKSDFLSSWVSEARGPAASNFRACYLLSASLLPLAALRSSVWPQILVKPQLVYR